MTDIKLLLVEDDLTDQMSFERFVKREHLPYIYDIAGSVEEAIEALQKNDYEIILADHGLGDGTAFDLFAFIPDTTSVIFVTGSGGEDIAVRALKMGAADYLTKDLGGQYLKLIPVTINHVLKAKAAERELDDYRNRLESLISERTTKLRQEIGERQQAEEQLRREKERALITLKSIGDAVITTSKNGIIEFLNPVAEKLTGWRMAEARGRVIDEVFNIYNDITRKPLPNPVFRVLATHETEHVSHDTLLINRYGIEYSIQDSAAPIHDKDRQLQGVVLVFSDVTASRRLSKELAYQAAHDPLTGLVNRREFEVRLNRVLKARNHGEGDFAFCYLDLDQFKIINDTCGHTAGDELLKQVTTLLQHEVRVRDTLARLGGDEFGILMEHCTIEQGERLANSLREIIANYRFSWERQSFRIGVSIGLIAIDNEFHSLNDLLMIADACCYAAKDAGRNRVYVYQKNAEEILQRSGQMHWIAKLNEALDKDHFRIYKHHIKSIHEQEGEHYEILVRIEDNNTLIPPGAFIPAAERYGLMPKIDQYIIAKTFAWLADNPGQLAQLSLCTINLSGHTLGSEGILASITRQLDYYALPPHKFCFEITETAAISNLNMATTFITTLKESGCQFALDDFGSGLSSFAYLKNLPVDYLKIDGIFVQDICNDEIDLAMVKSINEIGHLMGKKTIAEFVENKGVYDKIVALGIDFAQGYWISQPVPLETPYTAESYIDSSIDASYTRESAP
jgi:diguanylate cyclase (GGDEF)-like protein/PAS domain S-box-containing protein